MNEPESDSPKLQNLPIAEALHRRLKSKAATDGKKLREFVATEVEPLLWALLERQPEGASR